MIGYNFHEVEVIIHKNIVMRYKTEEPFLEMTEQVNDVHMLSYRSQYQ